MKAGVFVELLGSMNEALGHSRDSLACERRQLSGPPTALRSRGLDHANLTALPATRLRTDDDLDVLAQAGQKAHQSLARKIRESAVQQRGDLWLVDAHDGRRGDLLATGG
jgi:hypothetical protein